MPLWQEAPRGAGAGLAGVATVPGKAAGCADARCAPHRSASKMAPRKTPGKTLGKNRAVNVRMRLPIGCRFAGSWPVVALLTSQRHARPKRPDDRFTLKDDRGNASSPHA